MKQMLWFVALVIFLMSLACAGRQTDENKSMCDRPANVWKALSKKTKDTLQKVCDIKGQSCLKAEALSCRATWTYAAQFHVLEHWQQQHKNAPTIDKLDAYISYYLKPTLRMHEEYWGDAITQKSERQALANATSLMRTESKMLTDDYIVMLRNDIRAKTNPKERALLIQAYSIMKRLNTKAFEPFDQYDVYRKDVRSKLERYEKIKIQLEFVEQPSKPALKPKENKPSQPKPKAQPKEVEPSQPKPTESKPVESKPAPSEPTKSQEIKKTEVKPTTPQPPNVKDTSKEVSTEKKVKETAKDDAKDITEAPEPKKVNGKVEDQWSLD